MAVDGGYAGDEGITGSSIGSAGSSISVLPRFLCQGRRICLFYFAVACWVARQEEVWRDISPI